MPAKVPLCFRGSLFGSGLSIASILSDRSPLPGLGVRAAKARGRDSSLGDCAVAVVSEESLKMCMVSVAEDTQSNVDDALKDMLNMREGIVPRRNWNSFLPSGMENTRMIVPLSDAVASRVPSWFIARHERGARCASITFIACRVTASRIRT